MNFNNLLRNSPLKEKYEKGYMTSSSASVQTFLCGESLITYNGK
jgi:hypothetical protein